jgi:hypothetical protein
MADKTEHTGAPAAPDAAGDVGRVPLSRPWRAAAGSAHRDGSRRQSKGPRGAARRGRGRGLSRGGPVVQLSLCPALSFHRRW